MINRRAGLLIAQTLLGLVLLVAWIYIVDLEEVGQTLSRARWYLILLAAMIALSSTVLRAIRWWIILRSIAQVPLIDILMTIMASSLVNFVIPLRTGELARSLLLKKRHRVSIAASLPTVAVDRSFDLLAVLVVGTLGAFSGISLGGRLSTVLMAGGVLFLTFVVFVVLAIVSGSRLQTVIARLLPNKLGSPLRNRILGILESLFAGFMAMARRPAELARLFAISLLSAVLDGILFYFLLLSLGAEFPLAIVLTGFALFTLTFLVPGAPGYIGSMEVFGSLVFGALGMGVEIAASTVVLFHALNAVILGVTGGLAMWALGLRPSTAVRSFIEAGETNADPDQSGVEE